MAVEAHETEPGKVYRRTRRGTPGTYFKRPKTLTAAKFVKRLRRKVHLYSRDVWLLHLAKAHPEYILLIRYSRGTCSVSGRFEVKAYILVPPDMRLRVVKSPPGYKERWNAVATERS